MDIGSGWREGTGWEREWGGDLGKGSGEKKGCEKEWKSWGRSLLQKRPGMGETPGTLWG